MLDEANQAQRRALKEKEMFEAELRQSRQTVRVMIRVFEDILCNYKANTGVIHNCMKLHLEE